MQEVGKEVGSHFQVGSLKVFQAHISLYVSIWAGALPKKSKTRNSDFCKDGGKKSKNNK